MHILSFFACFETLVVRLGSIYQTKSTTSTAEFGEGIGVKMSLINSRYAICNQ